MEKISPIEKLRLENAVAPETFLIRNNEVFYFDRINRYEGRFCRIYNGIEYVETEIDESQGVYTNDGEKYLININNNNTIMERLSEKNRWERLISLEGIFFNLKKNETGKYVCLGNVDSVTVINIFNHEGNILKDIRPENIVFGSSVCLYSDNIYLGAIGYDNRLKVLKLNYMGNIDACWDIHANSQDRIISKICIYNNYIYMLVEGKSSTLILLNRVDGSVREIFPKSIGLSSIVDFDIYGNKISILDGRNICTFICDEMISVKGDKGVINLIPSIDFIYYRYHIYSMGLRDQIKFSMTTALIPALLIGIFLANKFIQYINGFNLIRLTFYFYVIISYFIASIKNIIIMGKKESRIEYLLSSCKKYDFNIEFQVPLFFGLTSFAMVEFGMYPEFNAIISTVVLVLTALLFYGIDFICIRNIRNMDRDMVVELLEDSDRRTFDYVRKVVNKLRENNADKFYIKITSGRRITEQYLDRWRKTRSPILGQNIVFHLRDNNVIAELDLSKRDIKYSRFSIIMDFVCYIKSIGEIKEIQVEYEKKDM